jgi:type II secretory pathway pseudopilin PulG
MAELIVAMTLLGLILAGLAVTLIGTARFNRYQWARQQCIAAAQAQLDSLTATGKPLADEDIARLWPDVNVTTDRSPGQQQWQGLELVQISATSGTHPRPAVVHLARYIRLVPESREGGQT